MKNAAQIYLLHRLDVIASTLHYAFQHVYSDSGTQLKLLEPMTFSGAPCERNRRLYDPYARNEQQFCISNSGQSSGWFYLDSDAQLIQCQQLADCISSAVWQQHRERRPVACERLVGHQILRHLLRAQLHLGLAIGQRIGLGKEVAHELVVVAHNLILRRKNHLRPKGSAVSRDSNLSLVHEGLR